MAELADFPVPSLLDPDRTRTHDRDDMSATEHRSRAQLLEDALRGSCAYGQQLWNHLDATRRYLMSSLPGDPTAGASVRQCAAPTGPDDAEGWNRWIAAYTGATSILAGPNGDSGFANDEARLAAQTRRARNPVLLPELVEGRPSQAAGEGDRVAEAFVRANAERLGIAPAAGTADDPGAGEAGTPGTTDAAPSAALARGLTVASSSGGRMRLALEAVLMVLALRGLRTRRPA